MSRKQSPERAEFTELKVKVRKCATCIGSRSPVELPSKNLLCAPYCASKERKAKLTDHKRLRKNTHGMPSVLIEV